MAGEDRPRPDGMARFWHHHPCGAAGAAPSWGNILDTIKNASEVRLNVLIDRAAPWQTDAMLQAYLEKVRRATGADNAEWLIAYRGEFGRDTPFIELLDDWKVMDMAHSEIDRDTVMERALAYQALAEGHNEVSPLTRAALNHTGQHRTHHLQQVMSSDQGSHWVQTSHLSKYNIQDRTLGVFSLNAKCESYLIINRAEQPFQHANIQALQDMVISHPRLHHWLMLERGLSERCERPLSPRQQQLVHLLLQPYGKAELAEKMGLAQSTVHSYTMTLYRNFQVSSRQEFMSLWFSAPAETTTTTKK